jgi:hypothetical protein
MTKFVAAGAPAGVVACVLFSMASPAWGQDNSNATGATQPAAQSDDSTALPDVVVTAPKEKKKASTKKVAGKGAEFHP